MTSQADSASNAAAEAQEHARTGAAAGASTSGAPPKAPLVRNARDRAVARVLFIVLLLNLLVATIKLTFGVLIGALALLADGVHSLLDASSNIVGLIGIAIASRPADEDHPYGHRRFETLAAIIIGLLVAAGAVELGHQIYAGLTTKSTTSEPTLLAAVAVAATVFINFGISRYERRRSAELRSAILEADADHTLSDALAAIAVLGSFVATYLGVWWADLAVAAIVTLIIARTAYSILSVNLGVLADVAQLDCAEVRRVVGGIEGVRGVHHIRSRGAADHIHLDLHIQLDPQVSLIYAHDKTHEVDEVLREVFPSLADIVIHTEPDDGHGEEAYR